MSEFTSSKASPKISERLKQMRKRYKQEGIPTILDESLNLLITVLRAKNPQTVLEIGTATGMSGVCILQALPAAKLTTIEADELSCLTARENFASFGVDKRVHSILADAGDVIKYLQGPYDFIFLDGAKARYYDYLPYLTALLPSGGVLFADNVLFRGLIECEKPPHRNMTIVRNMRAFIDELCFSSEFDASVLDVGDGVLLAVKK